MAQATQTIVPEHVDVVSSTANRNTASGETIAIRRIPTPDEIIRRRKRQFLKVKIKTLAEESRIIRRAIWKTKDPETKTELHLHRVKGVRSEARHAGLAYGFLRGRTRYQVENGCRKHNQPDQKRVFEIARRFCTYQWSDDPEINRHAPEHSFSMWWKAKPRHK